MSNVTLATPQAAATPAAAAAAASVQPQTHNGFAQPQPQPQQQQQQQPVAPHNWSPSRDGLAQMVQIFADPDPSQGSAAHAHIYQQHATLSRHPEYTYYLAYILMYLQLHATDVAAWTPHSASPVQIEQMRSKAGLELKNRIKDHWEKLEPATCEYVKGTTLATINHSSPFLRNIVGTIITTICSKAGIKSWPGVLERLCALLDSGDGASMEGAFNALAKIAEDMPKQLDSDELGRPLNVLMPKFIQFLLHPNQEIRKYAIATVNVFILSLPNALLTNMDAYMHNLFTLAGRDGTKEIRKRVCQAFALLLRVKCRLLKPHMEQIIQFMLNASNDDDPQVAIEACEFWSAYCEPDDDIDDDGPSGLRDVRDPSLLAKYLDHLVPILLRSMAYSQDELSALGQTADDNEQDHLVPDRAEDIKPKIYRSQGGGGGGGGGGASGGGIISLSRGPAPLNDDFDVSAEDDDDDDYDDDDEEVTNWTLRKCAANGLDSLAKLYGADLLPHVLPKLQAALNSKSENPDEEAKCWLVRESGVLTLGAIAEGCFDGLKVYLPDLIPFLVTHFLTDAKPLIRSITCWTLSRYCRWLISETINTCQNDHSRYFAPFLQSLLARLMDHNKTVQAAACAALATLIDESRMMLKPYLKDLLTALMYAFQRYQAKNLLAIYDCISTLSDAVGRELDSAELIPILMPPLMQKWNTLSDDDRAIFSLLECLTAIAQALNKKFFQFAEPVFARCMVIIEKNLLAQLEADQMQARGVEPDEWPDPEFIVCALDLLSGLAEGLEGSIESLVAKYDKKLLGLLFQCVQSLDPDVRQSAFALLGDLAKSCIGHIRPHLDKFLPIAAQNLNPDRRLYSVCNNASWAIGEIAMKAGSAHMAPYVPTIMLYLQPILLGSDPEQMRSLLENASITIGRLAYACADQVAPHLRTIAKHWLQYLTPLECNMEKAHAFKGVAMVIQRNPSAIYEVQAFPELCAAIASWKEPNPELASIFTQLLHSYKNSLQQQWIPTFKQCDLEVQKFIAEKYQL